MYEYGDCGGKRGRILAWLFSEDEDHIVVVVVVTAAAAVGRVRVAAGTVASARADALRPTEDLFVRLQEPMLAVAKTSHVRARRRNRRRPLRLLDSLPAPHASLDLAVPRHASRALETACEHWPRARRRSHARCRTPASR